MRESDGEEDGVQVETSGIAGHLEVVWKASTVETYWNL